LNGDQHTLYATNTTSSNILLAVAAASTASVVVDEHGRGLLITGGAIRIPFIVHAETRNGRTIIRGLGGSKWLRVREGEPGELLGNPGGLL